MGSHRTSTTTVVSGSGDLEAHEELLLDQMTADLGPCPCCGVEHVFLTFWTPWRTVHVIVCALCGTQRWASPAGQTS